MNVWLVTVGEPLPIDEKGDRLHRGGLLAEQLVHAGHNVLWWSATFNHAYKTQRAEKDERIAVNDNLSLQLLYAPGYKKNVSLQRVMNHYTMARKFRRQAINEQKPDIIIASFPTIELSLEAVKYGCRYDVPVIVDVRDLWPDIFLELAPKYLRWLPRLILAPLFHNTARVFSQATAVVGLTDSFRSWGLTKGGREKGVNDRVFPMGYPKVMLSDEARKTTNDYWQQQGVDKNKFIVCFFGYLGRQFDLDSVFKAAQIVQEANPQVQFVICGDGDNFSHFKAKAKDLKNVIMPGWVVRDQIIGLMEMSSIGLAPYIQSANFINNMPNKIFEYLSGGLVILSSIDGEPGSLLKTHHCGYVYSDAQTLAKIIINVAKDKDLQRSMGERAIKAYEDEFRADRVYSKMVSYMEDLVNSWEQVDRNPHV